MSTMVLMAQIIEPLDYTTFDPLPGPIYVNGAIDNPNDFEMKTNFHVENVSDDIMEIRVRRFIMDEVSGSSNKFCWAGVCYDIDDDISANTIEMNPGDIFNVDNPAQQFIGYYYHNDNPGCTTIDYAFSDVNNSSLNASIRVVYGADADCQSVNVDELSKSVQLSTAAPNPASANTMISFDYGYRPSNGQLVIHDMMGKKVKEIPVEDRFGVLVLNVEDLPEGIYLYMITDSNRILDTKKLVVSR